MKTFLTAALMLSAASFATLAVSQQTPNPGKPVETPAPATDPMPDPAPAVESSAAAAATTTTADAQSMASAREVAVARRAYRDTCARRQSREFCECVGSGVSQALMPQEVRIATRGVAERLSAQGDAAGVATETDATAQGSSSQARIEQVEGHYADACAQFRR